MQQPVGVFSSDSAVLIMQLMLQVTAILYANPNWCPADGGKLRLWPPRTLAESMPPPPTTRADAPAGACTESIFSLTTQFHQAKSCP